MNKILLLSFLCVLPFQLFSQANCNNPVQVTLCPAATLTNQTNAGMLDDSPVPCNIAGEDLVYEIYAPNNAQRIHVSLINSTGPSRLTLKTGSCLATSCYTRTANAGNSNHSFTVSPSNYYYLWIDAGGTITYDISIGGDTSNQVVYTPNTMGNLSFDWCAPTPFFASKPFFEVEYNGVYQSNPMTLAPLNVPGIMCITFYLANTSGVSGPKTVNFNFNPAGMINISTVTNTIQGFYNSGNWIAGPTTSMIPYTFNDSAGTGRGDFTGTPNTCLKYTFCFNIIPISNDPALTNVITAIMSDTYGIGYYSNTHQGCCPSVWPNCLGNGGWTVGNATGMAFGFDDPGGALPVTLIDFNARVQHEKVWLEWSTASEINCDYFTVEKSVDEEEWNELAKVKGSGNSTVTNYYSLSDEQPMNGITYYRLAQTDYDGTTTVYESKKINYTSKNIKLFPNPADRYLNIEGIFTDIKIINSLGEVVYSTEGNALINVEHLPDGIYLVRFDGKGGMINKSLIIHH